MMPHLVAPQDRNIFFGDREQQFAASFIAGNPYVFERGNGIGGVVCFPSPRLNGKIIFVLYPSEFSYRRFARYPGYLANNIQNAGLQTSFSF